MSSLPPMSAEDVVGQPARTQFEVFLDEHRRELNRCLDGLTEEQARRSLVPSRTTLLGLVKHAATGAARSRCAGCTSTCCASSLSIAGTQTSCESSFSTNDSQIRPPPAPARSQA